LNVVGRYLLFLAEQAHVETAASAVPRSERLRYMNVEGPSGANASRPTTGYPSATIGRVAQTEECTAHRHEPQFDCSYSRDKADFILKRSDVGAQMPVCN